MEYSRTEFAKLNIIFAYLKKIILIILEFIIRIYFLEKIGKEILGVNGVFVNILQVLSLAELGVNNVILYSFYEPLAYKNQEKIQALVLFYQSIYRNIAFFIFLIGILIAPFLKYIINANLDYSYLYTIYFLFLFNSVISYFFIYKNSILKADQKAYISTKIEILILVLKGIFQIILLNIFASFIIYLFVEIISTFLNNFLISKTVEKKYNYLNSIENKRLSVEEKKNITNLIKAGFIYKISGVLLNSTNNILISIIVSTVMVGYYLNYNTIYSGLASFYVVLFNSLTPSIGNLIATDDKKQKYKIFKIVLLIGSWLGIVFSISYFLLVNDFVILWIGEEFVLKENIVFIISIMMYISCILHPIYTFREATGLYMKVKYIMLLAAVINIILSAILGLYKGLFGIFLGNIITTIITYFWYEPIILYQDCFNIRGKEYFKFRIKDSINYIFVFLFIEILSKSLFIANTWLLWVLKAFFVFLILNIICLIIYKDTDEFVFIKNKIKKCLY